MSEEIEMLFGLWTRVGPKEACLTGGTVHTCATWRTRLNHPCSGGPNKSAAMRPYVN